MVGIGGIVLFICTFFWWFGYGLLWPLLGIAAVVLVALERFGNVDYPFPIGWAYIAIGGLAALIGLIRLIDMLSWAYIVILARWYIAVLLGILAGAAVLVGGIIRVREGY